MAKPSQAQILRQKLEIACAALAGFETALGEAVLSGDAEAIDAAREALAEHRQRVADLRAALPVAEKVETEKLAARHDKQAEELRRRSEVELKALVKEAMAYSIHTANQVSSFRRLVRQAGVILGLLFDSGHPKLEGLTRALQPITIHRLCEREMSRLGLPQPSSQPLGSGNLPAPGAKAQLEYYNAPSRIPDLAGDFRALAKTILAAFPGPQASAEQADLPQVPAAAQRQLAGSAEPATAIPAEETV
jgi:hypothetical protein